MSIAQSKTHAGGAAMLVRHFFEMAVAMLAGMMAFGMLFRGRMLSTDPASLGLMALFMTAPMVAVMRWRKHSWALCAEMTVAMLAPWAIFEFVFGPALGLSGPSLMLSSHGVMLAGMAVDLLARRHAYMSHAG